MVGRTRGDPILAVPEDSFLGLPPVGLSSPCPGDTAGQCLESSPDAWAQGCRQNLPEGCPGLTACLMIQKIPVI